MNKIEIVQLIRPEHLQRMKKLKIKTKVINNIYNSAINNGADDIEDVKKALQEEQWYWLLSGTFVWDDSPEEFDYWNKIAIHKS